MSLLAAHNLQTMTSAVLLTACALILPGCKPSRTAPGECANPSAVHSTRETWEFFDEKSRSEGGFLSFRPTAGVSTRCSAFVEFLNTEFPLEVNVWTAGHCFRQAEYDFSSLNEVYFHFGHGGGYTAPIPIALSVPALFEEAKEALADHAATPADLRSLERLFQSSLLRSRAKLLSAPFSALEHSGDAALAEFLSEVREHSRDQAVLDFIGFSTRNADMCGSAEQYSQARSNKEMIACAVPADTLILTARIGKPVDEGLQEILQEKARTQEERKRAHLNELAPESRALVEGWLTDMRLLGKFWENEPTAKYLECVENPGSARCPVPELARLAVRFENVFSEAATSLPTTLPTHAGTSGPMSRFVHAYVNQLARVQTVWLALRPLLQDKPHEVFLNANYSFQRTLDLMSVAPPEGFYGLRVATLFRAGSRPRLEFEPGSARMTLSLEQDLLGMAGRDSGAYLTFRGLIPLAAISSLNRNPISDGFATVSLPPPRPRSSQRRAPQKSTSEECP